MSSRGPSIPPARKPRAPAQPRAEPVASTRVRRKSPLNEANLAALDSGAAPQSTSLPPRPVPKAPQTVDIDSLTSGMKKIKLTLTTQAQRDAKEQAKRATQPAAAKPVVKPSRATKPRLAEKSINGKVQQAKEPRTPNESTAPVPEPQPKSQEEPLQSSTPPTEFLPPQQQPLLYQPTDVPLPRSSPPSGPVFGQPFAPSQIQQQSSRPTSSNQINAPNNDVFMPYQPKGPTPGSHFPQNPIQWLPPNTGTPSPMKRGELPVFTSTGTIPFGAKPSPGFEVGGVSEQDVVVKDPKTEFNNKEADIWEIPETPQK